MLDYVRFDRSIEFFIKDKLHPDSLDVYKKSMVEEKEEHEKKVNVLELSPADVENVYDDEWQQNEEEITG